MMRLMIEHVRDEQPSWFRARDSIDVAFEFIRTLEPGIVTLTVD